MLESNDPKIGYNASTGVYEDMLAAGIIDPAKVRFLLHIYTSCKHWYKSSQMPRSESIQDFFTSRCTSATYTIRELVDCLARNAFFLQLMDASGGECLYSVHVKGLPDMRKVSQGNCFRLD